MLHNHKFTDPVARGTQFINERPRRFLFSEGRTFKKPTIVEEIFEIDCDEENGNQANVIVEEADTQMVDTNG